MADDPARSKSVLSATASQPDPDEDQRHIRPADQRAEDASERGTECDDEYVVALHVGGDGDCEGAEHENGVSVGWWSHPDAPHSASRSEQ